MADSRKGAADESLDPKQAAKAAVREADPSEDAPTYSVERLTGDDAYALTGYEGHVVVGALSGVAKKNLTIEETKAAVKAWLDAPAKEA